MPSSQTAVAASGRRSASVDAVVAKEKSQVRKAMPMEMGFFKLKIKPVLFRNEPVQFLVTRGCYGI
jgi:hypothetical protein